MRKPCTWKSVVAFGTLATHSKRAQTTTCQDCRNQVDMNRGRFLEDIDNLLSPASGRALSLLQAK